MSMSLPMVMQLNLIRTGQDFQDLEELLIVKPGTVRHFVSNTNFKIKLLLVDITRKNDNNCSN